LIRIEIKRRDRYVREERQRQDSDVGNASRRRVRPGRVSGGSGELRNLQQEDILYYILMLRGLIMGKGMVHEKHENGLGHDALR